MTGDVQAAGAPGWIQMFLDVPRPDAAAAVAFWAEVTGWTPSEARGEHGQFVGLTPAEGDSVARVQAVGSADSGVHLDLDTVDVSAATARARSLGATHVGPYDDVQVMRSPGGLPFCLAPERGRTTLIRNDVSVLDQVCIDVPARLWDSEVAFWQRLTGRDREVGARPEFAGLVAPEGALRILLQRLDHPDGPARAHPDFAVADRPEQTARHLAAGAELLVQFDWWTVLLAPGGQTYCLTDRAPSTGDVPPGAVVGAGC